MGLYYGERRGGILFGRWFRRKLQSALRYAETCVRCRVAQVISVLASFLRTTAGNKIFTLPVFFFSIQKKLQFIACKVKLLFKFILMINVTSLVQQNDFIWKDLFVPMTHFLATIWV
jgi:hypothetical protein